MNPTPTYPSSPKDGTPPITVFDKNGQPYAADLVEGETFRALLELLAAKERELGDAERVLERANIAIAKSYDALGDECALGAHLPDAITSLRARLASPPATQGGEPTDTQRLDWLDKNVNYLEIKVGHEGTIRQHIDAAMRPTPTGGAALPGKKK